MARVIEVEALRSEGTRELDVTAVHAAHADFVWRSLHRLGVHQADLPDLLQEVFVVVHRRRRDYDGSAPLRSWLFGISVRLVRNYRRKAFRRREKMVEHLPEHGPGERPVDPEDGIALRLARGTAERLLDELDPARRAVFVMFEVEQLGCDEIARALGIPVGTVYSRLHAARAEFARAIERLRAREWRWT